MKTKLLEDGFLEDVKIDLHTAKFLTGSGCLIQEKGKWVLGPLLLKLNMAICKKCNTFMWSEYRHDFITCECDAVSIDGGFDYVKISGNIEDLIFPQQTKEKKFSKKGGNKKPTKKSK